MSKIRYALEQKLAAKRELEKRLRRKRCEEDFAFFVQQAWPVLEPAQPLMWGRAMDLMCDHLEAVRDHEITRLIINCPPGMSKSTLMAVMFPAWIFTTEPTAKILSVAHNLDLALRDSVRCRRLIQSEWYQEMWPQVKLAGDQNAKAKFEIEGFGGFRQALAAGAITGVRADHVVCLPYESMLYTSSGKLPIGEIVENKLDVKILGLGKDGCGWQEIEAYERNPQRQFYRITTESSVLECTEDHRIFVKSRGWIAASEINAGDYVYSSDDGALSSLLKADKEKQEQQRQVLQPQLLQRISQTLTTGEQSSVSDLRESGIQTSSTSRKNCCWPFLWPKVRWGIPGWSKQSSVEWRKYNSYLPKVWGRICQDQVGKPKGKILLGNLRPFVGMGRAWEIAGNKVSGMWNNVQIKYVGQENLLTKMWRETPRSSNFWGGQWALYPWGGYSPVSAGMDEKLQSRNKKKGQSYLSYVSFGGNDEDISCASYRLQQGKFERNEFNNRMPPLPWENAREIGKSHGLAEALVKSVEKINRVEGFTYNVRVAPYHNYFANGVLVHNCDDLISATDAMSEAVRNSMKDWVLEALPTRLNNPGGEKASTISLIQQRLHEDDPTGVLLERNLGYEHLMLPMEYDPGRHCVTSIGEDWRTEEGELLFPERFPRDVVDRDKQALGPWAVASQFQQSPSPRGGGLIRRDQFLLYDAEIAREQGKPDASKYPDMDIIICSIDTAYTTKQENDASAITVWGIWQKGGASARSIISSYADNRNVYDMNGKRIEMVDDRDTIPCAMLMYAKELRVPLHGDEIFRREGETPEAFRARAQSKWGLCEHITDICKRFNVDVVLIEAKASGISVAQEIKRINKLASWSVKLVNPGNLDKVARVYSVQPIFSNNQVYAPDKDWAEKVILQCEVFPRGRHDDLVDTVSQALRYLRDNGFLSRPDEVGNRITGEYYTGGHKKKQWVYDV